MDSSSTPQAAGSPLQHFRAPPKRKPLHPRERLLLAIVGLHLVILPWALGGAKLWMQFVSLALSSIGFAIALLPRTYTEAHTDAAPFRLFTWPKLLRFPVFWAGALLLGYVVLQAVNPAWTYGRGDRAWWMEPSGFADWLPRGTSSPFHVGGPWRALLVYAAGWMLVCSIWIGFTRRRTAQLLFVVLAANGFALAAFAMVQRLAGNGLMFWFYRPSGVFFGTFIYKNHAGAYLLLVLALSVALASWYYLRGLRRLEKSNPAGLFVFFSATIGVNILISYSRGATVGMLVYLAIAVAAYLVFQRRGDAIRRPIVTIVLLVGFGYFLHVGLDALSAGRAWDHMGQLLSAHDLSIETRQLATLAAWDMFKANWPWGTGAGSFQFLFPYYQQHYPEIFMPGGSRLFWDHAHNDLLEFACELGMFGLAVIVGCFGFWACRLARSFFWENAFSLLATIGCGVLVAYAWIDFPFQNPAILLTWCACWPAITLWTEQEERALRS